MADPITSPNPISVPDPNAIEFPDETQRDIKRLIVCCDGTWQSSDQGPAAIPTNITRIARAINCVEVKPDGHEIQQIVFYQSGVGSGNLSTLQRTIAGGVGLGLDQHVREAYAFLAHNFQLNDEIFLFGFSRGAYTARAVAGVISSFGILTKEGMEDFNDIYENYKKGAVNFRKWRHARKKPWPAQDANEIKVVGCFDTVGSVGLPENWVVNKLGWNNKYKFHNTALSRAQASLKGLGIENAFHALALDEHRKPFSPTLWYLPEENDPPVNLQQCWFPGVHTNIGGGYDDQQIADMTLCWMIDRCAHLLSFDTDYLSKLCANSGRALLDVEPDPDATPVQRIQEKERSQSNAWANGTVYNSSKGIMSLSGNTPRTPGNYGMPGSTNEWMHPSVRVRYDEDRLWKSKCRGLTKLEKMVEDEWWKWFCKEGTAVVKEWVMKENGWEMKLAGAEGMAKVNRKA